MSLYLALINYTPYFFVYKAIYFLLHIFATVTSINYIAYACCYRDVNEFVRCGIKQVNLIKMDDKRNIFVFCNSNVGIHLCVTLFCCPLLKNALICLLLLFCKLSHLTAFLNAFLFVALFEFN